MCPAKTTTPLMFRQSSLSMPPASCCGRDDAPKKRGGTGSVLLDANPPPRNFETTATFTGESMKIGICVYRKEMGRYIHCPVGYGSNFSRLHPHTMPSFCSQCQLQPCVADEYKQDIFGRGHSLVEQKGGDMMNEEELSLLHSRVCDILIERTRKILRSVFGKECTSHYEVLPKCIWSKIHATFPSEDTYSVDSEEEEEAYPSGITLVEHTRKSKCDETHVDSNNNFLLPELNLSRDIRVVTGSNRKRKLGVVHT